MHADSVILDPTCSVEWSHPLNRGLVAEWTVPPLSGQRGGKFKDLVRGGRNPHDGTLTNGPTWVGGGRRGGYGAVALDGTNDYVSLPFGAFSPLTRMTLSMWVKPTVALTGADVYYWDASAERLRLATAFATYDGLSGVIQIGGSQTSINVASGIGGAVGKWLHLAMTYDGATFSLWANGKVVGTPASVSGNLDWTSFSDSLVSWGANTSAAGAFGGNVDSMVLYNRGLSSGEVAALYAESRAGNPNRWRWMPTTAAYFAPPAAPTGSVGNSDGVATASGVGASLFKAVGSSDGTATVSGVGSSIAKAVGNADGLASVAGVGASLFKAVGNADGTVAVSGVGAALAKTVGNADGTATVAGVGTSIARSVGNADGAATVAGVGASISKAVGNADGTVTVSGVGASLAKAVGNADGAATVAGVGAALAKGVGNADGVATVAGVGASSALGSGVGAAAGTATVAGIGRSLAAGAGAADGSGSVSGAGSALAAGVGTVTTGASALGAMVAYALGAGTANGRCSVDGVGDTGVSPQITISAVGSAAGTCSVIGIAAIREAPRVFGTARTSNRIAAAARTSNRTDTTVRDF